MAPKKGAKSATSKKGKAATKASGKATKKAISKAKGNTVGTGSARAKNSRANAKVAKSTPKTTRNTTKTPSATTHKSRASAKSKTATSKASAAKLEPKTSTRATKGSKKVATAKTTTATSGKKRAREEDEGERKEEPLAKKQATTPKKLVPTINTAPVNKLNIFVFGEGSGGELGLGHTHESGSKKVLDVKRPRLNPNLLLEEAGVVQIAAGGMHVVALTHDNKILTWGVNDQSALGRQTKSGEQLRDADSSDDDDALNSRLNPLESKPAEVDYINVPEGTIFTKVAAGDSITLVLTSTGLVYGCGTFRANEGILGFNQDVKVQEKLYPIERLRDIVDIVCGSNHVLALDKNGNIFAFGAGEQNQLGRPVIKEYALHALKPSMLRLPRNKIRSIATGSYHSFAIDKDGDVWAWGANSFGQTGITKDVGSDNATVMKPSRVESLKGKQVFQLSGGVHHSVAATQGGEVLGFGRCDGGQLGIDLHDVPKGNFFHDEEDNINKRLLVVPTALPEPRDVAHITSNTDHNIAVTNDGKAYSWGFSENYQTGLGVTEDVTEATLIDNSAVRDQKLIWAGAGGQYGIVASCTMESVE